MITYEHPLNERIRAWLRLEDLLGKIVFLSERKDSVDHHMLLLLLCELLDLVSARSDWKSDLLSELEKTKNTLSLYRGNPEVYEEKLEDTLLSLDEASSSLTALSGKVGANLRDSEFLMAIKSREGKPGGLCQFDLPSYFHWLNRPTEVRLGHIRNWLAPLQPIHGAVRFLLELLRESVDVEAKCAREGHFQLRLGSHATEQLVRVELDEARFDVVPEISANKHALNIRFLSPEIATRPYKVSDDIEFNLMFCHL